MLFMAVNLASFKYIQIPGSDFLDCVTSGVAGERVRKGLAEPCATIAFSGPANVKQGDCNFRSPSLQSVLDPEFGVGLIACSVINPK